MEDDTPLARAPTNCASLDDAPVDHDDGTDAVAISVAATQAVPGEPGAVTGYVVVSAGIVTISDMLAESYPPQPGGSWLLIPNPEQLELGETQSFNDTTWTSQPVRLVGRRVDDTFVIDDQHVEPAPDEHGEDRWPE